MAAILSRGRWVNKYWATPHISTKGHDDPRHGYCLFKKGYYVIQYILAQWHNIDSLFHQSNCFYQNIKLEIQSGTDGFNSYYSKENIW